MRGGKRLDRGNPDMALNGAVDIVIFWSSTMWKELSGMLPPLNPGNMLMIPALLLAGCVALTCGDQLPRTGAVADGGWPAGTSRHDEPAGMDLVWVPAGSFVMGSSPGEEGRQANDSDEGPQHLVTISRGFWLGKFEVTQDQWEAVTGRPSPAHFKGARHPVENVSWDEVQIFIGRLNQSAGSPCYRLPTEAEWEYACRAGSSEPFSFGRDNRRLSRYAWFRGNADRPGPPGRTRPVGLLRPNRWGLHDMHGNVWEWCADRYTVDYYAESPQMDPGGPAAGHRRVKRGGSWFYPWHNCRSADRARGEPDLRSSSVGFRLVRDAD